MTISKNITEVFQRCASSCPYGKAYPECPFRVIESVSLTSKKTLFTDMDLEQAKRIIESAAKAGCPSIGRLH